MALWEQTPGLDEKIRGELQKQLPHVKKYARWYNSGEFCDIIKKLDQWVYEWEQVNQGIRFSDLSPQTPIGRIIDIIYWSHDEAKERACRSNSPSIRVI